jgi:hypothetical protein
MAQEKSFEVYLQELRSSLKWAAGILWIAILFSIAGIITLITLSNDSDDDDEDDSDDNAMGTIIGFSINLAFAFAYAIYITILARRAKKFNGTGGVLGNHTGTHGAWMCVVGLLYTLSAIATGIVGICTGHYMTSAYFFFALMLSRFLCSAGVAAGELKKLTKSHNILPLRRQDEKDEINVLQSQIAFMSVVPLQQQPSNFQFQTQTQPIMQEQWNVVQPVSQSHPQFYPQQHSIVVS